MGALGGRVSRANVALRSPDSRINRGGYLRSSRTAARPRTSASGRGTSSSRRRAAPDHVHEGLLLAHSEFDRHVLESVIGMAESPISILWSQHPRHETPRSCRHGST